MNIEISTKELQDLLDIIHIADVIMSGHRSQEDTRSERHRALIQKLYAAASAAGAEAMISYNENDGKYIPTGDFERFSLAHPLINEFVEHLFWDQLISRLSLRDAVQAAGGIEHLSAMSNSERQKMEAPIRQRYIEEFAANGVANLEVLERFGTEGMPVQTAD